MRPRQEITEVFSTYMQFESDPFTKWVSDPRLRKSMQRCLLKTTEAQTSKTFFSLYWYHHWQENSHRLAVSHLCAYLQEAAYWAAYKFSSQFSLNQFSLTDCFQIAFSKFEKGLTSFNPERGVALESFGKLFFKSTITNELRKAKEVDVSSDWLLLRKLTQKQLKEALRTTGGLEDIAVAQYRLAWMCFRQQYAEYSEAGRNQLSKPTPETWAAIAELYNRERMSQLTGLTEPIDAVTVEHWLSNIVKWARQYLYPSVASLNIPSPGFDSGEAQDNLSDDYDQSILDQLLIEEDSEVRERQQQSLVSDLRDALTQLKEPGEALLRAYYCEGLKQREIAERLQIKQYSVSRKLTQVRKALLTVLVQRSQETLKGDVTPEAVESISNALELWLQSSFCET